MATRTVMRCGSITDVRRVGELDGVRGLAILMVVAAHTASLDHAGGAVGVTLFFTLSGYLITGLLLREHDRNGRIDLRAFWARRARRLLPALAPVAVLIVLLGAAAGSPQAAVRTVALWPISNYAYALGATPGLSTHTWSLAVEEQWYLVWPLLAALVARRRWLVGLVVALAAWRVGLASMGAVGWAYLSLGSNAYALLAGAVAASCPRIPSRWAIPAVSVLVALTVAPLTLQQVTMAGPVVAAASVASILAARGSRWLGWTPLRYCGRISYGWYLWHYPLVVMGGVAAGGAGRAVGAVVAFGIAGASWRWLEQPILNKKQNPRPAVLASKDPALENGPA